MGAGLAGLFACEFAGRSFDPPVGAVDQLERNAAVGAQPLLQQVIGSWLVGDDIEYGDPQAGDYRGTLCVSAGTPGTWKRYGQATA